MNELEKKLRDTILKMCRVITVVCFAFDVIFLVIYVVTDDLFYPLPVYIMVRVVPPTVVNILACIIGTMYNRAEKVSNSVKNEAVSSMLCTVGGSMAIFHSFFTPLWVAPSIGMLFCGIFGNTRLRRILGIYSLVLVTFAAAFQTFERPGNMSDNLQSMAVVYAITYTMYLISGALLKYIEEFGNVIRASLLREQELTMQMHFEPLTGIFYTRPYFMEKGTLMLERCCEEHPVSIAMVDFDHFKSINDKYGHDNGDIVIKQFARLSRTITGADAIAGRYGGEEFIFMFEGGDPAKHYGAIEYLRERFSQTEFEFTDRMMTFSCGIVVCRRKVDYDVLFDIKVLQAHILCCFVYFYRKKFHANLSNLYNHILYKLLNHLLIYCIFSKW